jgi:hypothetical protein
MLYFILSVMKVDGEMQILRLEFELFIFKTIFARLPFHINFLESARHSVRVM